MLNHDSQAMQGYHQAKRLHWNPRDLDFSQDHADWSTLGERERDGTLQLCTLFLVGEEAVTHDLAPLLIGLRRRGGHTEDEIFLATQLYEEAKHTEFFDRWLGEVPQALPSYADFLTPSYHALFLEKLPRTLDACLGDPSPLTLARACVVYHMIIEGVLAETGYHIFAQAMRTRGLFPGLLEGVTRVQQDEARHIAFGLHLIHTLVQQEPDIWPVLVTTLNDGLMLATGALAEAFAHWGDNVPFNLSPNDAIEFAARQFSKRLIALQR